MMVRWFCGDDFIPMVCLTNW